ncbi:MAG: hypothetical protein BCS36_10725 [Desulfovibrio sp. MES5]|nr:MAG: hypothetical protein BCS36_10725 [Desulfovibrio sp. MES5]
MSTFQGRLALKLLRRLQEYVSPGPAVAMKGQSRCRRAAMRRSWRVTNLRICIFKLICSEEIGHGGVRSTQCRVHTRHVVPIPKEHQLPGRQNT